MANKWLDIAATEEMDSDPTLIEFAVGAVARHIGRCKHVLDIGCANGVEMEILLRENDSVVGIDLSEISLNLADNKGHKVSKMDMHEMTFEDNSFDLVFMKDVFEHSVSHIQSFSEACRVSSKYVAIILPDESYQSSGWHYIIPTIKQMISLGMKCGMNLRAYDEYNVLAGFRVIGQRLYIFEKLK